MEFEKKFVHCVWDESLVGKLCVFADDIPNLRNHVEQHDDTYIGVLQLPSISPGTSVDELPFPFYNGTDARYMFVYYDPNFELKIAHEQGKKIQYLDDGEWFDTEMPSWSPDVKYRVKPKETWYVHQDVDGHYWKSDSDIITVEFEGTEEECDAWIAEHTPKTRRMTNKELARWLAEGKGECVDVVVSYISAYHRYAEGTDDKECDEDIRIRAWDEEYWHEPLVEVKE